MEQIDMANMSAWEFISSDIMLGFKYEDCTPAHNVKKNLKKHPDFLKGMDIKDFVEIVILGYDQ